MIQRNCASRQRMSVYTSVGSERMWMWRRSGNGDNEIAWACRDIVRLALAQ